MKVTVTVCELRHTLPEAEQDWAALCRHTRQAGSQLVVLPEMPFAPWIAATREVDADRWQLSVDRHDRWIRRLDQLGAGVVVGTRPVNDHQRRFNQAFVWERTEGCVPAHVKRHLPDEPGFWEASWYARGPADFRPVQTTAGSIGFLICTEIWFGEHARAYGRQGVDLLVCPRATPTPSIDKWIAGGRTAAVVSGAFCLSSNLRGPIDDRLSMGGAGWIISPDEADVLGLTSHGKPFVTMTIDLAEARRAKQSYPRYVAD